MTEQCSIQGGDAGNWPLFRAPEGRIVDANLVEEPRRPAGRLDRFEDHRLPFAPDRDGVPFEVKSVRQLHRLRPISTEDFGSFHGASPIRKGLLAQKKL